MNQQAKIERVLHNAHLPGDPFFLEGGPVGVLLSHGYTATPAEVRLLAERLHAAGHTVAGLLLPGHGSTPAEMSRCTWRDWAEAVEVEVRLLKERCATVFVGGESMGALLALYTASRHPEIAGVLTYAPAMRIATHVVWASYLLSPFVPHVKKKPLELTNEYWQGYTVHPIRALRQLHRLQLAVRQVLPRVRQPLLIVQARLDTAIDPRGVKEVFQRAGSRFKEYHWMEDSGHALILDKEIEVVSILTLRFMGKVLEGSNLREAYGAKT